MSICEVDCEQLRNKSIYKNNRKYFTQNNYVLAENLYKLLTTMSTDL